MGIRAIDTNRPAVVADVRAAFSDYEEALVANDIGRLDRWFWDDPRTVRYGIAENLYGHDEIAAWRAGAQPVPATRYIENVVITTFGDSFAVVDCEFSNGDGTGGRQSQAWARFDTGWR